MAESLKEGVIERIFKKRGLSYRAPAGASE